MKYNLIILLSILLLLASCNDFVSPKRFTKTYYTVNALLQSGQTISYQNPVWIGKVVQLEELNSVNMFVDSAYVRIIQTTPNGDTLSFNLSKVMLPDPQNNHPVIFYIDPAFHVIQPEYTYRIEIIIPGYDKLIYAETTVPKAVQLVPNFNYNPPIGQGFTLDPNDSTTCIPYNQIDLHYPVTIQTDGYQTVNYFVEIYCREPFSTSLEFTYPFMGQENPPPDMESEYNQAMGQSIRRIWIMNKFISKQHSDGNWYVSLTDYRHAFVFYGRYKITVKILDDNAFKYRYHSEGYYYGGVKNAFGCFGSCSGDVMYTKIVR